MGSLTNCYLEEGVIIYVDHPRIIQKEYDYNNSFPILGLAIGDLTSTFVRGSVIKVKNVKNPIFKIIGAIHGSRFRGDFQISVNEVKQTDFINE